MHFRPRTLNQHRENADDAAADVGQDRLDPDFLEITRLQNIEYGMSPDEAELLIIDLAKANGIDYEDYLKSKNEKLERKTA